MQSNRIFDPLERFERRTVMEWWILIPVLGLRSTATGPAVAAERVWVMKNGKNRSASAKSFNPSNGVDDGQTCKLQVGRIEAIQLFNSNNRVKQAIVRKPFMALNACVSQRCILITPKRKDCLIHLLSIKNLQLHKQMEVFNS